MYRRYRRLCRAVDPSLFTVMYLPGLTLLTPIDTLRFFDRLRMVISVEVRRAWLLAAQHAAGHSTPPPRQGLGTAAFALLVHAFHHEEQGLFQKALALGADLFLFRRLNAIRACPPIDAEDQLRAAGVLCINRVYQRLVRRDSATAIVRDDMYADWPPGCIGLPEDHMAAIHLRDTHRTIIAGWGMTRRQHAAQLPKAGHARRPVAGRGGDSAAEGRDAAAKRGVVLAGMSRAALAEVLMLSRAFGKPYE